MRYCTNCNRITTGDAIFCNICGRSYDVRFCPRLHPNPRAALVCSQCGSRELSSPQPKGGLGSYPIVFLAKVLPGVVLITVTAFLAFALIEALISAQQTVVSLLVQAGVPLLVGWLIYLVLPDLIQRILRTLGRAILRSRKHTSNHKNTGSDHR
jgi:hypothetical protein